MADQPNRAQLGRELDALAGELMGSARRVLLRYFDDSCGGRLELTPKAKVVVRLEVRRSSAYLEVDLSEVGEGKKTVLSACPIQLSFTQAIPEPQLAVKLTADQLSELAMQERRGPQFRGGKHRAKVQDKLVERGCSMLVKGMYDITDVGRKVFYAEVRRQQDLP